MRNSNQNNEEAFKQKEQRTIKQKQHGDAQIAEINQNKMRRKICKQFWLSKMNSDKIDASFYIYLYTYIYVKRQNICPPALTKTITFRNHYHHHHHDHHRHDHPDIIYIYIYIF